jgi:RHS repeat-associated protein
MGFTWSGSRVSAVTAPNGKTYGYSYSGDYLTEVTLPDGLGSRTYHYEAVGLAGHLTGVSVNGVRYSRFNYFADGRVQKSGLGSSGDFDSSTFSYAADHVNVTNALGQTTKYLTSELNNVIRIVGIERPVSSACPAGWQRYTSYDVDNNIDFQLDAFGVKTQYTYNADDRVIQKITGIGPGGESNQQQVTQYEWDPAVAGRLLKVTVFGTSTAQPISETTYTYFPDADARKRLLQSVTVKNLSAHGIANSTQVTSYDYTLHPNKLVATATVNGPVAGSGDAVVYTYDATGNLTSVGNSLNHTTSFSNYNALGLPERTTSANGAITDVTYDARGSILSRTEYINGTTATTIYQNNEHGQPKKVTHPDGKIYQYGYVYDGRPAWTLTTRPVENDEVWNSADGIMSEINTITYNNVGRPTAYLVEKRWNEVQPICNPFCELPPEPGEGPIVEVTQLVRRDIIEYDVSGLVRAVKGNNGQDVRYSYDANGDIKTITDSLNQVTTLTYDRHRNVIQSVGPLGQTTTLEYDRIGRLTNVIDPRSKPTTYVYDGFGQLWSQTSPDTGVTTFQYNAAGQRTAMTRQSGAVTTYGYDALGRLTSATSAGEVQTFGFDTCTNGKSRLCQVTDPTGSVSYAYTPQGRLASQTSTMPAGGSAQYTYAYDTLGRLTQIGYPGGVGVGYAYAHGKLRTVTATIGGVTQNVITHLSHQPYGPAADWNWGNGLRREAQYDIDGRMTELRTRNNFTFLQRLAYQYTPNNEVSAITNHANTALGQTYGYDGLSRLTSVTASGANQAFSWDANGNRTNHTWGGATDYYDTHADNNRLTAITGPRATAFTYDSNGNTLTGEGATYTYNAFNRLTTATKAGVTSTYAINALGQRVHKKVGAGPNQWFTYSPGGQLLGEFQGSWSNYVWLGGTPVARIKDGQVHMIHTDHLGRPEIVTSSAKAVVWRASNYAFDRTVTQDSIGGLNLGFPGQYHDAETGLAYNYFRTYNPRTGRYLESDPIGLAGGLNTYSYANSNPASFVDPHGKIAWKAVVAVVACAYGVHTGVEGASAYKDAIREYDAKALDEANRREKEDPCPNDFNDYFDEKQHRDGLNARIRHGASEVGGEIWGRAVVSTVVVGAVVGDSFIKGGSVGLLCFGAGLAYGYFGD